MPSGKKDSAIEAHLSYDKCRKPVEEGVVVMTDAMTEEEKFNIILERNTFFFRNEEFEEGWESYISSITNLLLLLKRGLDEKKSIEERKRVVVDFIIGKQDGLSAVLALTGISEELLLRLVTFVRTVDDKDLNKLVNKDSFPQTSLDREWSKDYLFRLVRTNPGVAEGIVNLLFEAFSVPILRESLPLFELKKLNFSKLDFSIESLVDSIVRHAKRISNVRGGTTMQIIKCSKCGNTEDFREQMFIVQYNYFCQGKDGRVDKVDTKQINCPTHDSRIYCSVCSQEIDEDYHLFLDRYTETLFNTI